jgi:CubicO group peptidase (beta-lactamase class C family)
LKIRIIIFGLVLVFAKKANGQFIVSKIDSIFLVAVNQKAFNGNILIAKNGNVIYEKSAGFANIENRIPNNINTQFQIASVSKQFTAFGIMVLKKEGKINYDDYVTKYIPNFPYNNITLKHLLQHTSGLPNFWKDIRPNLDTTKSNGNKEMIAYLINKKLPLQFDPGENWEYADIGYDILATIIENVSEMSYQNFMYKKVFKPAGLKHTKALMVTDFRRIKAKYLAVGYIEDSVKGNLKAHEEKNFVFYLGNFFGDGSVISTARDLKKWDDVLKQYLLNDSAHFAEAYKPIYKKDNSIYEMQKGVSYGFGWGIRNELPMGKQYSHSGGHPGFITNYYRYPDKGIVLIVCRNIETKNSFAAYLTAIRNELNNL